MGRKSARGGRWRCSSVGSRTKLLVGLLAAGNLLGFIVGVSFFQSQSGRSDTIGDTVAARADHEPENLLNHQQFEEESEESDGTSEQVEADLQAVSLLLEEPSDSTPLFLTSASCLELETLSHNAQNQDAMIEQAAPQALLRTLELHSDELRFVQPILATLSRLASSKHKSAKRLNQVIALFLPDEGDAVKMVVRILATLADDLKTHQSGCRLLANIGHHDEPSLDLMLSLGISAAALSHAFEHPHARTVSSCLVVPSTVHIARVVLADSEYTGGVHLRDRFLGIFDHETKFEYAGFANHSNLTARITFSQKMGVMPVLVFTIRNPFAYYLALWRIGVRNLQGEVGEVLRQNVPTIILPTLQKRFVLFIKWLFWEPNPPNPTAAASRNAGVKEDAGTQMLDKWLRSGGLTGRVLMSRFLQETLLFVRLGEHWMKGEASFPMQIVYHESLESDFRCLLGKYFPSSALEDLPEHPVAAPNIKLKTAAQMYTPELASMVVEHDAWIFKIFGYSTEPPAEITAPPQAAMRAAAGACHNYKDLGRESEKYLVKKRDNGEPQIRQFDPPRRVRRGVTTAAAAAR